MKDLKLILCSLTTFVVTLAVLLIARSGTDDLAYKISFSIFDDKETDPEIEPNTGSSDEQKQHASQEVHQPPIDQSKNSKVEFTFHAFGDSGWARTHVHNPVYNSGFKGSYKLFDPERKLIGDLNYINWESSIGKRCDSFWTEQGPRAFAFLTRPEELADALSIGFNIIGLANNHSHDCNRASGKNGVLQSVVHVKKLKELTEAQDEMNLFSGIFENPNDEPKSSELGSENGSVPIRFLSAYVGGNSSRCDFILCDIHIDRYAQAMKQHRGLKVLALHSWDEKSHARLKTLLRTWLKNGLADIALGTGPHVAESVEIVETRWGPRVLATSLGNFIHPSLTPQKENIVLRSKWVFDELDSSLKLKSLKTTGVSCAYEKCQRMKTRKYTVPSALESAAL